MEFKISIIALALGLSSFLVADEIKTGKTLFEDKFESPEIKKDWQIEEGKWEIRNGWLFNQNGGTISLRKPSGGNFVLEADVRVAKWVTSYPWVSIVFSYSDKENRSEVFITPGEAYYKVVTIENGQSIDNAGGKFSFERKNVHKMKIICEYNNVSFFWDGKLIANTPSNCMDEKIAFIGNSQSADFEIKNVCIKEITEEPGKIVKTVKAEDLAKSEVWDEHKFKCEETDGKKLFIDKENVFLSYNFSDSSDFRGTFLRIPVNVGNAQKISVNIDGDASRNKFFIIAHDKSGEQHLLSTIPVTWTGSREIKVDMKNFFQSPPERVIEATHWDGDKNQKIDFPIIKLDIGICKREKALKQKDRIGINNLRFEE